MSARLFIILSVIGLGALFVLPLWKISLVVPQYPQDISIYLHINKIEDGSKKALMIMNVLNHNVGMKEIKPEEFSEFAIFPIVVAGFIISGLSLVFLSLPRWATGAWVILLLTASAVAMFDFYLWLYDFGHNLDPEAALKIEGQSFQPPIIGVRKVVNLEVHSFPSWGALAVLGSLIAGAFGWIKQKQNEQHT